MLLKRRRSRFIYTLIYFSVTIILWRSLTNKQQQRSEAIVTLLAGDSYLCGALVLGYTLKKYGATNDRDLFVLIPHGTLNNTHHRSMLKQVGWKIINVKRMSFPSRVTPRLVDGLVKLYAWNMTQYTTIATLDSDTMLLGSIEEPFETIRDNSDIQMLAVNNLFLGRRKLYQKWKNKYFNTGVLFFGPKMIHFENLIRFASNKSYYELSTPQQNLLNTYYLNQWHELSMIYNLLDYIPHNDSLYKDHWNKNTRIVHFAGYRKPWQLNIKNKTRIMPTSDAERVWHSIFSEMVNTYGWTKEDFLRRDASKSTVLQFDF